MIQQLKYVKTKSGDFVFFCATLAHSNFKFLDIESAGFCGIDTESRIVHCYGLSISLGIGSQTTDTFCATRHIFGIEEALKTKEQNEKPPQ